MHSSRRLVPLALEDSGVEHLALLFSRNDLFDDRSEITLVLQGKQKSAQGINVIMIVTRLLWLELLLNWQRVMQERKLRCDTKTVCPVVFLARSQALEGLGMTDVSLCHQNRT